MEQGGRGYLSYFGEEKALGGDIQLRFPAPPRDVQGWEGGCEETRDMTCLPLPPSHHLLRTAFFTSFEKDFLLN